MEEPSEHQTAVELLQELGLKEYEARSFVALSRLSRGTAKEIAELSEVPRTRIYESIRELESYGLVEIQHSNPQVFKAVPIDEAVETLRTEYETRTDQLEAALQALSPARTEEEVIHEVWTLSGANAVANRTHQLIDDATDQLILVVGDDSVVTADLLDRLQAASDRGASVAIGSTDQTIVDELEGTLPDAAVFRSELDWLTSSPIADDDTKITRLLLIDLKTILVSSTHDNGEEEQAVFGRGFDNGVVTITRRLLTAGLRQEQDPAQDD